MLFEKLFRVLVLGGAMVGTVEGCEVRAQVPTAPKKDSKDGGAPATPVKDGGTKAEGGGGAPGW